MKRQISQPGRRLEPLAKPTGRVRLSHGLCFLLGILVTVGAGLWWTGEGRSSSDGGHGAKWPPPPWGELEYTPIVLERPEESLGTERLHLPPPAWFFPGFTEAQVLAMFTAPDLTESQQRQLTNRAHWQAESNGWQVLPPVEVLRSLSPAARARLYGELFKHPQNRSRGRPFRLAADRFDDWLAGCRLPAERAELFRRLSYREGEQVCLADFEVLEAECSLEEQRRLRKAFSQTPTLLMKLRVTPEADLESLARYWSGGRSPQAMRPFLEALARVPGGASVSVSFFFPPFARMRLYTYPDLQTDPQAARQDCYWTALNFFHDRPTSRYFSEAAIRQTLRTDYAEVPPPWSFGDLVLLLEEGRTAIHLCVHVADEVVFTKNGSDPLRPWVLQKLADVVREYEQLQGKPVQAIGLRRKTGRPS